LFEESQRNGWLLSLDWDDYDMKRPILKSSITEDKIMKFVQDMYKISFHPEFILRKLLSVRDSADLKYYLRAARRVIGHIVSFSSFYITAETFKK
ncbi:MAG: hypothetical protein NC908_04610, partial [Candidatus Omnitrophica bacterium]|nr:hypothetical protein [Candidatus Omnitrophota bacterium]